ncbi:phosphate metabolism protein 7 [Paramarasmius palmivorus]|uniref:Phosphate metabolism protein 7 n=1 Tax=Paramarasmius palmivorus TaxID=297713 RepID=A0AAW0CH90_9AGAR
MRKGKFPKKEIQAKENASAFSFIFTNDYQVFADVTCDEGYCETGGGVPPPSEEEEAGEGVDLDLFSKRNIKKLRRRIKKIPKKIVEGVTSPKTPVAPRDDVGLLGKDKDMYEMQGVGASAPRKSEATDAEWTDEGKPVEVLREDTAMGTPRPLGMGVRRETSYHSFKSEKSHHSKHSHHSSSDSEEDARTEEQEQEIDPPDPQREDDDDPRAFDHPSTYKPQRWIWVPRDQLGLSSALVQYLKDRGVEASDEGADMDMKGVVEVTRGPPDEEWAGGHDL